MASDPESFIPMTEAAFFILAGLHAPNHGYAIIQGVAEMSRGRVELGPGTLYGALQRFTKQGLVERVPGESGEDDRRKLYRLTNLGMRVLALETDRFEEMAGHGRRALGKGVDA